MYKHLMSFGKSAKTFIFVPFQNTTLYIRTV